MNSLLVFGWPLTKKLYVTSLMSNVPIGLSTMVLGSVCTSFLTKMDFDTFVYEWLSRFTFVVKDEEEEGGGGDFYSCMLVMVLTGVWSFVLTNIVNSTPSSKVNDKKEL